MDLEKFFDRVNHDILMSRLIKIILNKSLLKLIMFFFQTGMMQNKMKISKNKKTSQDISLSLLFN